MEAMIAKITKFHRRMKNIFDEFDGRRPRVLLTGLDGAGKTALLYKSKLDNTIYANVPPRGINIEHMTPRRGASIQVYDMTGNKMARLMWQRWFRTAEAIVYVVDSADKVRMDEAKFELHDLLQSRDLRRIPLIVVANKQDMEGAISSNEVSQELDLASITNRDWSIFGTSAKKGTGVSKVFKDVVDKVKAYRHYKSALQAKPDKRTDSKKSVRSEKSDSVSHCSSIEEPMKVKSLFESISEKEGFEQETEKEKDISDYEEETSRVSEQNSETSVKYDAIDMGTGILAPDEHTTDEHTADEHIDSPTIPEDTSELEAGETTSEASENQPQESDASIEDTNAGEISQPLQEALV